MHEAWQDQLPSYVAGQLSPAQCAALEQHLAGCSDCRRVMQLWQDVARAVRDDAASRVPAGDPPPLVMPPARPLSQSRNNHRSPDSITYGRNASAMNPPYSVTFSGRVRSAWLPWQRVFSRLASALLALVALGVIVALGALFASRALAPEPGGLITQSDALTPTVPPTVTPVPPTATPIVEPVTLRRDAIHYEQQTWNNDGPATLAAALSYFGWDGDQTVAARWLRPDPEDKSVTPWQLVHYATAQTPYTALSRMGGTAGLLKQLLAADFPVIVQTGFQPADEGWMGHYVLLVGYDDAQQVFLTFDSYLGNNQGQGRPQPYAPFDDQWRHFNRTFIVVYDPARERDLTEILDEYADPEHGYTVALEAARDEIDRTGGDKWAWFNMGTAYTAMQQYDNAAVAFDQALDLDLPFRMLWYQFGPYEAYYQTGDYNKVLQLAINTYNTTSYIDETYYWRGMAYMAKGRTAFAFDQFKQLLRFNPNFEPAQASVQ